MSIGWKMKFGFITMTISPLIRKILTLSSSKGFLVVANKVGGIVKVFDVIPSIPFRIIPGPVNKVLNRTALVFLHYLFVKQMVYFKGFGSVSITLDKHKGGHVRTGAMKGVIGWGRRWL